MKYALPVLIPVSSDHTLRIPGEIRPEYGWLPRAEPLRVLAPIIFPCEFNASAVLILRGLKSHSETVLTGVAEAETTFQKVLGLI